MNHTERREYSDFQYRQIGMLGNWHALLDIHNAVRYGFLQYRFPKPGKPIDTEEAEAHIVRIEKEWREESLRRDPGQQWTGAPPLTKIPLDAKLYLHSVLNKESTNDWRVPDELREPRDDVSLHDFDQMILR
jgi:hypothetical protein